MKNSGLTLALSIMLIAPVSASADGLLTQFVKDSLQITGQAVGGTVGLVGSTVDLAGNVVSGTVDSVGNVIDSSGRIVGRVVTPDQLVATPATTTNGVTMYGGNVLLGSTNDVYSYSLDTRNGDLLRAVDAAQNAGKLNSAQASQLRQDLASISTREINAKSDHLMTFDESLAIARDLDRVNTSLANMISVQPFGQLVALDNGGSARIFVTSPRRMGATLASTGSSSSSSRTTTISDSNGTTQTTTITSNKPAISSGALFSILDNRRYELDKKIGSAKASGVLTGNQAIDLQAKSDHVRLLMLDREAVLNSRQALIIARELDALDADVAVALKTTALTPLTIVDTTGDARIGTDQFGNVIAISEAGPDLYIKTLEGRRLELEALIAAGQTSGSIQAQQAKNLRAELDRVAQVQAAEKANNFTYISALPLAMSLDYVGHELVSFVPSTNYVPLINGSRFVVIGGRVVMLDDLMVRRAELESKIARKRALGQISEKQANTLRVELSQIAVMESGMRSKGALTFRESKELYTRFDKVGSRLDGYHNG